MIKQGKAEKWAARSDRLSAALRENLKRRKAQARGRANATDQTAQHKQPEIPLPGPDFRRNPGRE